MKSKALVGGSKIRAYLDIGKRTFYQLLGEPGFPVAKVGRAWVSHADELDNFFRSRAIRLPSQKGPR